MEKIIISKEAFDKIAPHIRPYLKNHCNYCGKKITKDSFGLLSRDITSCKSPLCLIEASMDEEELNTPKETNE